MVQPGLNTAYGRWAPAPRSVTGLGRATWILAFAAGAAFLLLALGELHAYSTAMSFVEGNGASLADVNAADQLDTELALLYVACVVAAAVLVIVWTYQARLNAELICTAAHRRSRGWVIGGWFCPVVNLWFPAMIMEDIYRASMPSTRHDHVSFVGEQGVLLIRLWWTPFLLSGFVAYFCRLNTNSLDGLHTEVFGFVISALLELAAAAALMVLIRKISAWQLVPKVSLA